MKTPTFKNLRSAPFSRALLGLAAATLFTAPLNAAVITAGNLVANLQNSDLSSSSTVWVNQATGGSSVGNFSTIGGSNANVQTVGGNSALYINTDSNNAMQSASLVPTSITGNNSFTLEAWVYTTNLYSGFDQHNWVGSYGTAGGSHPLRGMGYAATGNGSDAFATDNFNDLGYATNPPTGAWTLVDWTYDSSSNLASVYVNGTVNVSGNLSTLATTQTAFLLGTNSTSGGQPFAGYIGALRLMDGVLSSTDISNNLAQGVTGVVPEPSTYSLVFGGLGLLLVLRLRKQKSV